mmetsp:Transcript_40179/g.48695  ORF Transcript_40179/g.48695 Transcript_40179/m.48695 type:complete len:99 (+) Transcript_40179:505-801(+)
MMPKGEYAALMGSLEDEVLEPFEVRRCRLPDIRDLQWLNFRHLEVVESRKDVLRYFVSIPKGSKFVPFNALEPFVLLQSINAANCTRGSQARVRIFAQ